MPNDLTQFLNSSSETLEKSIFSKRKAIKTKKISDNTTDNFNQGFLIIFIIAKSGGKQSQVFIILKANLTKGLFAFSNNGLAAVFLTSSESVG